MTEAEAASLEDSSFSDPDQLEELRSAENDLIDEYARGEMLAEEKKSFERLFLASPGRRQRVEFAVALAKVSSVRSGDARVVIANRGRLDSIASLFHLSRPTLLYAAAFAIITGLLGAWLFFTRINSGNQIARDTSTGPQPPVELGSPSPQLANKQSEDPNSKTANGKPSLGANANVRGTTDKATVATFILLPGISRSEAERTRLTVPSGRQWLRFQVKLEEHDVVAYQTFAAELKRANGQQLWASQTLKAHGSRNLTVNIPLSKLPSATDNYELTLRGQSPNQSPSEPIAYYYLHIVKE